ncbi:MAG: SURF1 family protein [Alphaproteobacteria bacterium]|nr:SURF1 family protein [Alphaproteobacteria bacterium]
MNRKGIALYFVGLILLNSLGVWQLYRLEWKNNLISKLHQSQFLPPLTLQEALDIFDNFLRPVVLEGSFDGSTFYVIGKPLNGKAGYHTFGRFLTKDGQKILVNLGWNQNKNALVIPHKLFTLHGMTQPFKKFWFSPPHRIEKNEWGYADHEKMGNETTIPFYVQALDPSLFTENITALPIVPSLPNNHLFYALTWFILGVIWGIGGWKVFSLKFFTAKSHSSI